MSIWKCMKKGMVIAAAAVGFMAAGMLWTVMNPSGGVAVYADDAATPNSGTCGDNLTWELTSDGTLTISGTGALEIHSSAPWDDESKNITTIVIESGVTSIESMTFYRCYNLTSITISDSVTSIGDLAFYGCTGVKRGLTSITVQDGNSHYKVDGKCLIETETNKLITQTSHTERCVEP